MASPSLRSASWPASRSSSGPAPSTTRSPSRSPLRPLPCWGDGGQTRLCWWRLAPPSASPTRFSERGVRRRSIGVRGSDEVGEPKIVDRARKPRVHRVDEVALALVIEVHAATGDDRVHEAEQRRL